jgi:glucose-6-phosphate isomerase
MSDLSATTAWPKLQAQARKLSARHLREIFAADPQRAQRYLRSACGLELDFSKQRIDDETLGVLFELAEARDVRGWTQRLFAGDRINHTEGRAALHVALRAPPGERIETAGQDVVPGVHGVLDRMFVFAAKVREGHWRGARGEIITDIVNIGIGGSDLGPRMVCEALADFADGPRTHFVANVDGAQLSGVLRRLQASRTLFVVTSKTFTTQETMANAAAARQWLTGQLGAEAVPHHFVAVSTNAVEVARFGIDAANRFEFWDWVGGRYSLWSAVGLSVILAIGPTRFRALLDGAWAMDCHFRDAPVTDSLPVLMALLALWNRNALQLRTQVVAPYAQRLDKFVPWLQQLEMESNGKRVHRDGSTVAAETTPAIWGDVGTNSQHAFFQMLHQGSEAHPVDFILPIAVDHEFPQLHRMLVANCLAQAAALMRGKTADEVRAELGAKGMSGAELEQAMPHRVFPGNRPSSLLLMERLDPFHLGALLALYEHRTFVLSVLWDVNAFDQWGVELGKQLAQQLMQEDAPQDPQLDSSTRSALQRIRNRGLA